LPRLLEAVVVMRALRAAEARAYVHALSPLPRKGLQIAPLAVRAGTAPPVVAVPCKCLTS
jgi:hypothetical protein